MREPLDQQCELNNARKTRDHEKPDEQKSSRLLVLIEIPVQKHQIRERTVSQKHLRIIKDVDGYLLTGSLNRK